MRSEAFWLLVFILFLISSASIEGQSHAKTDSLAKSAFDAGDFNTASEYWKSLARSGIMSASLYYNIGRAESELGHIPEAMTWYEKSHRLHPFGDDARKAIEIERNKLSQPVIPVKPFFLNTWLRNFLGALRPGCWVVLGFIFLMVTLIIWYQELNIFKFFRISIPGKLWIYGLAGAAIMGMAFCSYRQLYRTNEAILYKVCEMKQGPAMQSPQHRMLDMGEKVKIIDELPGWNKIRLLNLDEGWIEAGCLKRIDLRDHL